MSILFFFKQKTAYEMRISDWSSDVCSSDLLEHAARLGYKRIVVFPYFLFTGILVQRIYDHTDIVAQRHPEIEFVKAGYLNDHPAVLDAFAERVQEILDGENLMNCKLCKYRAQVLGFEAEVGLAQERSEEHTSELQSLMRISYAV